MSEKDIASEQITAYIESHLDDPGAYLHKIAWELSDQADMSYNMDHGDIANSGWSGLKKAAKKAIEREGTDNQIRNFSNYAWKWAKGAMQRAIHNDTGPVRTPEYMNQLKAKIKDLQHNFPRKLTIEEIIEKLDPEVSYKVDRAKVLDALNGKRTWEHQDTPSRIDNQGNLGKHDLTENREDDIEWINHEGPWQDDSFTN